MTNQQNPPRTREAQIDIIFPDECYELLMTKDYYTSAIAEAEARGRAEALAELHAGAEPMGWRVRNGFGDYAYATSHSGAFDNLLRSSGDLEPLYTHPPVPREAELATAVERLHEVMRGIEIYADDTLTGPADGLSDALWFADGVREIRTRARAALAAAPEKRHD